MNTLLCFTAEARLHITKHIVEPLFFEQYMRYVCSATAHAQRNLPANKFS